MKLIMAETGVPPREIARDWPDYPEMFAALFRDAGALFEHEAVRLLEGEELPGPQDGAALLVTGSPAGVYEGHAFIEPLAARVREWAEAGRPVLGICFGHQLIAHAFGGHVEKSEKGWGVGVHTYEVVAPAPWGVGPERFACAVSHRDQVVRLPAGFTRIAGSPFCPNGVLAHEELPVLTFQMHPEFTHAYASALLALRSDRIPADRVELGQASLRNGSDRELIGRWLRGFVESRG